MLIVFDTLARNFRPGDENSTSDMSLFISHLDKYISNKCARMLIDHSGHGDKNRGRGSSVLKGALDAEIKISKGNDGIITMTCTKMKDAPEFSPKTFRSVSVEIETTDPRKPDSSVYLVEANSLGKEDNLSPKMRQAIAILDLMTPKTPNNKISDDEYVCNESWRFICEQEEIYSHGSFRNAKKRIDDRGIIEISGDYVRLSPMS